MSWKRSEGGGLSSGERGPTGEVGKQKPHMVRKQLRWASPAAALSQRLWKQGGLTLRFQLRYPFPEFQPWLPTLEGAQPGAPSLLPALGWGWHRELTVLFTAKSQSLAPSLARNRCSINTCQLRERTHKGLGCVEGRACAGRCTGDRQGVAGYC